MKRISAQATFSDRAKRLFSRKDTARLMVEGIISRSDSFTVDGNNFKRGHPSNVPEFPPSRNVCDYGFWNFLTQWFRKYL